MRRAVVLGALVAGLLVVHGGTSPTPSQACVTSESTGKVSITPANNPIGVHHRVGLQIVPSDTSDYVPSSGHFEIDGPGGHMTVAGDSEGGAFWTPSEIGHYDIAASWRMYGCSDGPPDFAASATAAMDALPEQRATGMFNHVRRREHAVTPSGYVITARVSVTFEPLCPVGTVAGPEPLVWTLYYERGRATPTHSSPHTVSGPFACAPYTAHGGPGSPLRHGRYFTIGGDTVTVLEPTTLRVLAEMRSAGTLVATSHLTFTPGHPGERLRFH
ncbi:MAG: hypothetical protein QOC55_1010 [Thermoleophilaceae bacterium]|jgi:hypothetical protein|nr:hypothetical protein [Thermoleophilaceae bacterium]